MNAVTDIVLIGGSAGSTKVLLEVTKGLKPDLNLSIVLVVHKKSSSDFLLGNLIASRTMLTVKEAEEKEKLLPGIIYIAPADYHLLFEKDFTMSLDVSEKINFSRPSIDVSFMSAALAFGNRVAGILISGANADGTDGLKNIFENGGIVAVQDFNDAETPYMPQYATERIPGIVILKTDKIAEFINNLKTA
ncbi:MAG: chemotaxis protein CheB [Chitinophagaceae bacterium]